MYDKSLQTDRFITDVLGKYANMVLRIAHAKTGNKADSEDIMQEVFIKLMRCQTQFNDDEHLKAWLIRVTVNTSKNLLTSAWFRRVVSLDDHDATVGAPELSDISDCVAKLPAKYSSVIHLHYYEDLSIAEMSATLGKKESTIKSLLHRGRKILKQKLKGSYDEIQ